MLKKLLITGAFNCDCNMEKTIKELGFEIIFFKDETQKLNLVSKKITGIICNNFFLYNDIKNLENLEFIQLTSAGLDRVPLEYIKNNNIKLFRAENVYNIPIAEWVILKILEIYKNTKYFYKNQESCKWEKKRDLIELYKKTICILGCGNIGNEIAKRLLAFECNVIGIDEKIKENINFNKIYTSRDLKKILKISDVIILTLPLTNDTKNIISKEALSYLKKDAILLNVARGELIKEKDLIEHLKKGYLKSVILDVFEKEPLPLESELWRFKNVIISPHNSFISDGNKERLNQVIINNLKSLIKSKNIV